jgi:hypothetical protein
MKDRKYRIVTSMFFSTNEVFSIEYLDSNNVWSVLERHTWYETEQEAREAIKKYQKFDKYVPRIIDVD